MWQSFLWSVTKGLGSKEQHSEKQFLLFNNLSCERDITSTLTKRLRENYSNSFSQKFLCSMFINNEHLTGFLLERCFKILYFRGLSLGYGQKNDSPIMPFTLFTLIYLVWKIKIPNRWNKYLKIFNKFLGEMRTKWNQSN